MIEQLASLNDDARTKLADQVRVMEDVQEFPKLKYWNYNPCNRHASIEEGLSNFPACQTCGIEPYKHQRIAILWSFLARKVLIADEMGLGKTSSALGSLALAMELGEFDNDERVLIVVRPSALLQWKKQVDRLIPSVPFIVSGGQTRAKRIDQYSMPWKGCVISYQTLNNDLEELLKYNIKALIVDDVDPLRNPKNRTAISIKAVSDNTHRTTILTGTPIQKRLTELYSVLEPIGGKLMFGSESKFTKRFLKMKYEKKWSQNAGREITIARVVGIQNIDELKYRISPFVLRRKSSELEDIQLPAIEHSETYFDMPKAQQEKYAELRKGVLRIIKEEGTTVKRAVAAAQFTYGQQICMGLAALGEPDNPGTSAKLDWLEHHIVDGGLSDEKVVVFIKWVNGIKALQNRLGSSNIDYVTIWGQEPDKQIRQDALDRFWEDPDCRVLIGSESIEQSLNVQNARHLVAVDTILNPARMAQLAGRVRRLGSAYGTVYIHSLFMNDTQEDKYMDLLLREQALSDIVWDDSSDLYEVVNPYQLLKMIAG